MRQHTWTHMQIHRHTHMQSHMNLQMRTHANTHATHTYMDMHTQNMQMHTCAHTYHTHLRKFKGTHMQIHFGTLSHTYTHTCNFAYSWCYRDMHTHVNIHAYAIAHGPSHFELKVPSVSYCQASHLTSACVNKTLCGSMSP